MGMDLQSIRTDTAKATAEFMGQTLNFRYRPALITPKTFGKLTTAQTPEDLAEFFAEIISSWDLTQGGEKVEITAENILNIPQGILKAVSKAIVNDVPQKEEGKD